MSQSNVPPKKRTGISNATRYLCKKKKHIFCRKQKVTVFNRNGVEIHCIDNTKAYNKRLSIYMNY